MSSDSDEGDEYSLPPDIYTVAAPPRQRPPPRPRQKINHLPFTTWTTLNNYNFSNDDIDSLAEKWREYANNIERKERKSAIHIQKYARKWLKRRKNKLKERQKKLKKIFSPMGQGFKALKRNVIDYDRKYQEQQRYSVNKSQYEKINDVNPIFTRMRQQLIESLYGQDWEEVKDITRITLILKNGQFKQFGVSINKKMVDIGQETSPTLLDSSGEIYSLFISQAVIDDGEIKWPKNSYVKQSIGPNEFNSGYIYNAEEHILHHRIDYNAFVASVQSLEDLKYRQINIIIANDNPRDEELSRSFSDGHPGEYIFQNFVRQHFLNFISNKDFMSRQYQIISYKFDENEFIKLINWMWLKDSFGKIRSHIMMRKSRAQDIRKEQEKDLSYGGRSQYDDEEKTNYYDDDW